MSTKAPTPFSGVSSTKPVSKTPAVSTSTALVVSGSKLRLGTKGDPSRFSKAEAKFAELTEEMEKVLETLSRFGKESAEGHDEFGEELKAMVDQVQQTRLLMFKVDEYLGEQI